MDYIDAQIVQEELFVAQELIDQQYQQNMEREEMIQQQEYFEIVQQQPVYAERLQEQLVVQQEIVQPTPTYLFTQNNYPQQQVIRQQQMQIKQSKKEELRFTEEGALMQSQAPRVSNSQFESVIYYNSFFQWKEGVGLIVVTDIKQIRIGEKTIKLNELSKIKIMKEAAINNSRKLKITNISHDILFSVQPNKIIYGMPLQFYWFAKIITDKLRLNDCDLNNPYIPQSTFVNKNIKNSIVQGIIFKQSQYLKTWELRFIAITPQGLFSFKDEEGNQTFSIKKDTVTEIWTRFDFHERLLVIKVRHSSRKTEFGIPIVDYCNQIRTNWLYAFYGLIFPS